jgi:peptidoglycan/xylan/chitin deacetylase (PgdA/CDA1 family)
MNTFVKGAILSAASHSALLDAYGFLRRKLTKSQVAILMYHRVAPKENDWSLPPHSPHNFEKHIEYLCRNYEILPLDELVHCLHNGHPLPEKAAVITFDDGYKDNYQYAYPILRNHKVPATIFLATSHIGQSDLFWTDKVRYVIWNMPTATLELDELGSYSLTSVAERREAASRVPESMKRLPEDRKNFLINRLLTICGTDIADDIGRNLILSWDEVREMHNDGIGFGAHTVTHPILTGLALAQAKEEIIQSKKDVQDNLGQQAMPFAYPDGDFNHELAKLVHECGFSCAVTTTPKLITSKDNPYELGRIGPGEHLGTLKVGLSGLRPDLDTIMPQRGKH